MKKLLSLFMTLAMVLSLVPAAFAADSKAVDAAQSLYELGLFKGTGTNEDGTPNFDLDRAPSRYEGVTMLVRLLGKEDEAQAGSWNTPFTDVANWAKPYVGYAYENGLTTGTSAATFGGTQEINASQYLTFVLRTLGYESGKDFKWDAAWELSDQIGLTDGEYSKDTAAFLRGDVAIISHNAYKLQEILATAPYWGLPADIKWIAQPATQDELDNNILYSFLLGNYSLDFNFNNIASFLYNEINDRPDEVEEGHFVGSSNITTQAVDDILDQRIKWLSHIYPELVGVYCNTEPKAAFGPDCIYIDFPEASLDMDEIYDRQLAGLEKAREIRDSLHESGKITDNMSEKQIAQIYYDHLFRNYLTNVEYKDPDEALRGRNVEHDNPYACLVERAASCVGKAGAFNLLLHLEGISAQGAFGQIKGTEGGHVVSKVVLDGETYYSDWGTHHPIAEDISSWFEFKDPFNFHADAE